MGYKSRFKIQQLCRKVKYRTFCVGKNKNVFSIGSKHLEQSGRNLEYVNFNVAG